ncbi:proteasome core particle subunit beta 2 [Sorochytrium milnesiophthora]
MALKTEQPRPGFKFDLCQRNERLAAASFPSPKATSTGTTIVGVIFDNGVVLGADTRSTSGPIVADKNCEKIHYIAPNIYCCGAGTAADTEFTTNLISSQLELHRLSAGGRDSRIITAMTMLKQMLFRYQGNIGAALILGGYDPVVGPQLYTLHPHGSTDKLPYVTMGSGSLAAMAIFEKEWRENMNRQEAIDLVKEGIRAGIFNDLGSGSNVDVVVIEADSAPVAPAAQSAAAPAAVTPVRPAPKIKVDVLRNYETPNERGQREGRYLYKRGTTAILKSDVRKYVTVTEESSGDAMDTDA